MMKPSEHQHSLRNLINVALAILVGGAAFAVELGTGEQQTGAAMYLLAAPLIWFTRGTTYRAFVGFVLSGLIVLGKILTEAGTDTLIWQQILDRGAALLVIWLIVFISGLVTHDPGNIHRENKPPRRTVDDAAGKLTSRGRGQGGLTQSVFNSLNDPAVIFDFDGYIIAANPALSEYFGHQESVLKGQSISFLTADTEPRGRESLGQLLRHRDPTQINNQAKFTGRKADGTTFPVEISVGEMPGGDDEKRHFIAVLRDVSAQEAEEHLILKSQQEQTRQRAGRLTASIVHDLRRSLGKAQTYLDLLAGATKRNPAAEDLLAPAMHAIAEANNTSNKILQFGRTRLLQPEEINLNDLITENLGDYKVLAGGRAKLETDLVPRVWPIRADRAYLEQAIHNLVANAAEALPDGKGSITIATGKFDISPEESVKLRNLPVGEYAVLTVEDTGTGMESNVSAQAHIPFFTDRADEGHAGLGMSEVFDFVRRSRGYTDIYSEPGKGAVIRLFFPSAKRAQKTAETAVQALSPVARKNRLSSIIAGHEKILYADFDDEQRNAVANLLKDEGYQILRAKTADDAIEILSGTIDVSTVIATEVLDGRVNGLQLIASAKELYDDINAVLISSGAMDSTVPESITVVTKPFRRQELLHAIRSQLRRAKD